VALEFHFGFLPNKPVTEVAELAAAAESCGFAGIWLADSQSIFRDAWVALTVCALRTERIALAIGVTNPVTRHPAVIAGSIATLDELSGGRAILGIGVGESAVRTLGLPAATLARLELYAHTARGLLAGETVEFEGRELRMAWPVQPVPIYFAASGPRSLRLAGAIADGVVFQNGSNPAFIRLALESIRQGEESAGRAPGSVKRLMRLACAVSEDGAAARDEIRGYVSVAANTARFLPEDVIEPELREDLRRMREVYDVHQHGSGSGPQAALVTDRVVDSFAAAGTPGEVAAKLTELAGLGIDGFSLTTTAPEPLRMLQTLAEQVFPEVRA
jgi:5,10-methylenetetrahydromethanopterin reductase